VARAAGKLRGRKPKLTPTREALLVDLHRTGQKSPSDLAELFGVGRSTVYRALERAVDRDRCRRKDRPGQVALSEQRQIPLITVLHCGGDPGVAEQVCVMPTTVSKASDRRCGETVVPDVGFGHRLHGVSPEARTRLTNGRQRRVRHMPRRAAPRRRTSLAARTARRSTNDRKRPVTSSCRAGQDRGVEVVRSAVAGTWRTMPASSGQSRTGRCRWG